MPWSRQLPFELEPASLAQWLESLNSLDPLSRGYELYKVLNLFKQHDAAVELDVLALCAERLTPAATAIVIDHLQRDLVSGHEVLSGTQCKTARLSIVLLELLAFMQACLALRGFDPGKRQRSCDIALQTLGLSAFHCALSYSHSPSGHWRTLGDLYQMCSSEGFFEASVLPVFPVFNPLSTLESLLKSRLLFSACQPLRFSRQELPALFRFCIGQQDKVRLNQAGRLAGRGFVWAFAEGKAPAPVDADTPKAGLLFDLDDLVKAGRNRQLALEGFDASTFWDGVTHYSAFAANKYDPTLAAPYVFTRGFDAVCRFFQNHVRDGKVSRINSPSPDRIEFSTFGLVQEEEKDTGIRLVSSEAIWSKPSESKNARVHFAAFKAFNTDRVNFIDAKTIGMALAGQELVALYRADRIPQLAIVRSAGPVQPLNGMGRALLEILPGDVRLDALKRDETVKTVLVLTGGARTELVAESGHYAPGATIELAQGGRFRLLRLLEETDGFVRYLIAAAT
ncbi:MAG: hypothetical protein ACU83N_10400 [Gammaproteobacteria bacterium]